MSLLTVERSTPSPHDSDNEDLLSSSGSSYEGFVARDHYALRLSPRPFTSLGPGRSGDQLRIFSHLKKLVKILRPEDLLRMVVELENNSTRKVTKYLVIITTNGYMGTEETIFLGTEQEGSSIRICLVVPLWRGTEIKLDGDGGFGVHTGDRHHVFKPSSVQSMWAALQMMYKATTDAQTYNYYVGGLSHTWMGFYTIMITSDGAILNEWNLLGDVESFRPETSPRGEERVALEKMLTYRLREVMIHEDLEEVTCKQLRLQLEKEVDMDLNEFRGFLDQQMLRILGQMERPSQIFDYLYLGSEWNASNLVELKELGVKYILNISREIDNFYPEEFKYLNIRLYDLPSSELMKHWDRTYTFLKEAKAKGKKALVHCKMGISRSAATVTAYAMKEYKMSLEEALHHVKSKRAITNPNEGFRHQLLAYEGILRARHNELWGKQAPSRPLAIHKTRSQSEPNLQDLLNQGEDEPELSFLEDGGEDSPHILHASSIHLDHSDHFQPNFIPFFSLPYAMSIDKTENIRNYLASLPNLAVEEDQGFGGENVLCTSESGSGYSSSMSTPTDDGHLHSCYSKLAREIRRESKMKSEGQVMTSAATGDKERAFSSIGIVLSSQHEVDGIEKEGEEQEKACPITIEESFVPSLTVTSVLERPVDFENMSSDQVDGTITTTTVTTETEPVMIDTAFKERQQAIAQIPIFQGIPKALKSSSLPCDVVAQCQVADKKAINLVYLVKHEPLTDASGDVPELTDHVFINGTLNGSVGTRVDDNDDREKNAFQLDDTASNGEESGTINDPQIMSVPKRVKEIEEMNYQKDVLTNPTFITTPKSSPVPMEASSQPDKDSLDIGVSEDNGVLEDQEDICCSAGHSSGAGIIRTSSVHSIASLASGGVEDKELECLVALDKSATVMLTSTRHASLSPSPSSQKRSSLDGHTRTVSCSGVPSVFQLPGNILPSGEEIVYSLGPGAVKARVLDIERSRDSVASSEELMTRRHSPSLPCSNTDFMFQAGNLRQCSLHRRPSSEIVQERSPNSDSGTRSELNERRGSTPPTLLSAWSKLIDDVPTLPVQDLKKKFEDSDTTSITSSMGSVGRTLRFHEQRKRQRSSNLRRSQSLRDVESPEKTRHLFRRKNKRKLPAGGLCTRTESPCSQD